MQAGLSRLDGMQAGLNRLENSGVTNSINDLTTVNLRRESWKLLQVRQSSLYPLAENTLSF